MEAHAGVELREKKNKTNEKKLTLNPLACRNASYQSYGQKHRDFPQFLLIEVLILACHGKKKEGEKKNQPLHWLLFLSFEYPSHNDYFSLLFRFLRHVLFAFVFDIVLRVNS